eukprot:s8268_g2.t1
MWQVKPSPRELPSWRTGLHSDWRLRLGPSVFDIHKVLTGHGPRASAFLCSAFTTGQQLATGSPGGHAAAYGAYDGMYDESGAGCGRIFETDLSHILPEQVWPFFSQALDFIYSEDLVLNEENAVPLLRHSLSSIERWVLKSGFGQLADHGPTAGPWRMRGTSRFAFFGWLVQTVPCVSSFREDAIAHRSEGFSWQHLHITAKADGDDDWWHPSRQVPKPQNPDCDSAVDLLKNMVDADRHFEIVLGAVLFIAVLAALGSSCFLIGGKAAATGLHSLAQRILICSYGVSVWPP